MWGNPREPDNVSAVKTASVKQLFKFTLKAPKRCGKDISLVNAAGFLHLFIAQLKVDVRVPGLLLRLPLHPALKHLPAACDVPQHLLHVAVFVPVNRDDEI